MKFVVSVIFMLFLAFAFYCMVLAGLAWLIDRESRLARFLGTLGAVLFFLHHAGGALQTISIARGTGWDWLAVVSLLMSGMFTLLFGCLVWVAIRNPTKKSPN